MTRIVAKNMAASLGKSFVVQNMPDASGWEQHPPPHARARMESRVFWRVRKELTFCR